MLPDKEKVDELRGRLDVLRKSADGEYDVFMIVCLEEALVAAAEGNFGVGAVLVRDGGIVMREHNHVFSPYFRSDLHAEMSLLTAFEDKARGDLSVHRGSTLYTSVEPCLMCLIRTVNAGVERVYYAAPDPEGGILQLKNNLPKAWAAIMQGSKTEFLEAPCSQPIKQLANDIVLSTARLLDYLLAARNG